MASLPLASTADLAVWLGVSSADIDSARADAVLVAASAVVRKAKGATYLDELGALLAVPDEVAVVCKMVASRLWHATPGVTQESAGPFSTTWTADALELTESERDLLGPPVNGTGSPALWTLGTTRLDDQLREVWAPVEGQPEAPILILGRGPL